MRGLGRRRPSPECGDHDGAGRDGGGEGYDGGGPYCAAPAPELRRQRTARSVASLVARELVRDFLSHQSPELVLERRAVAVAHDSSPPRRTVRIAATALDALLSTVPSGTCRTSATCGAVMSSK